MSAEPFITVCGHAAALRDANIDTDIIFPARFLLLTAKKGLGQYAFADRRLNDNGSEIAGFVFNREPFRNAPILIAGANFGSGSSREQAVWALHGMGIRCVIAPSFGEIFFSNCFRNGILPIKLDAGQVAQLMDQAESEAIFTVNLEAQTLSVSGKDPVGFDISAERKLVLANGWDETDLILQQHGDAIARFEQEQKATQPWLYEGSFAI